MKFSSGEKELNSLMRAVKDNPFDLSLLALQGGLFDAEPSKADGPEGGTAVDLSGDGGEPAEGNAEDAPRSRRRAVTTI
jgi:hypothetical protein